MVLALVGSLCPAAEIEATYAWECDVLPSAVGWTPGAPGPPGGDLEALMSVVTTVDDEIAVHWGPCATYYHDIRMDPTSIPGLPLGGAGDFTIEVRAASDGEVEWYQGMLAFASGMPGNLQHNWYMIGTHEDFIPCTKGYITDADGRAPGTPGFLVDSDPSTYAGSPSEGQNNWVISRLVSRWVDADGGATKNDIYLKWLTMVGDMAVWDVAIETVSLTPTPIGVGSWRILSATGQASSPEDPELPPNLPREGWIDYVRWIDQAIGDDDTLYPKPPIPGDINRDGVVNLLDLDILGRNYGAIKPDLRCDVNEDGYLNLVDLDILGQHYGEGGGAVPEPATVGLLVVGALGLVISGKKP